jgi:transcriptional regulator with XRE-family HTH domain
MANSRVPAAAEAPAPAAERRAAPRYGARVRALRLRAGLTQAALARQLGVSASYLNLIERDRRPLPAELLLRLAQALDVDLRAFAAAGDDARLTGDLAEVFGDALFEDYPLTRQELGEFATTASRAPWSRCTRRTPPPAPTPRRSPSACSTPRTPTAPRPTAPPPTAARGSTTRG